MLRTAFIRPAQIRSFKLFYTTTPTFQAKMDASNPATGNLASAQHTANPSLSAHKNTLDVSWTLHPRTDKNHSNCHFQDRTPTGNSTNQTHAKDGGDASIVPGKVQEKLPEEVERAVPNTLHDTGKQHSLDVCSSSTCFQ